MKASYKEKTRTQPRKKTKQKEELNNIFSFFKTIKHKTFYL